MSPNESEKELFQDLIGQPSATFLLSSALKKKRIAPAYLFIGPHGVGRRLATLRFLEGLLNNGHPSTRERRRLESFNHPDLMWVEPTYIHQGKLITQSKSHLEGIIYRSPPQIRLEQIRSITTFLGKQPIEANLAMVVIEAIETISESAANALLKTLEEPKNGLIILISSRPECLLPTIRSRCQSIQFFYLDKDSLKNVLLKFKENKDSDLSTSHDFVVTHKELINLAGGSPGALLNHAKAWKDIPSELWPRIENLPQKNIECLALARDICESLNCEQQLWLINWLEVNIWMSTTNSLKLRRLEKLRLQLISFVQPRLAWEVALLEINQN